MADEKDKTHPQNEGHAQAPRPGDMQSINEPPGSNVAPKKDPAEASPDVTKDKPDVSHETSRPHERDHRRR